jgi:hypothetical protein
MARKKGKNSFFAGCWGFWSEKVKSHNDNTQDIGDLDE